VRFRFFKRVLLPAASSSAIPRPHVSIAWDRRRNTLLSTQAVQLPYQALALLDHLHTMGFTTCAPGHGPAPRSTHTHTRGSSMVPAQFRAADKKPTACSFALPL